tara:strand:- start:2870 stop:3526 length:657 start_codon:yes stop_codon:yes gene_type:complete
MKIAATIPIKTRSTRVKGKNFRKILDVPLYTYIINNCINSNAFDSIYVDTDSDEIKEYCESVNVSVIDRDHTLADDTANGNDVFHYDINHIGSYDYYFQLFATAPFLKPSTIEDAVNKLASSSTYDSILTATEEYGWHWFQGYPVNYQPNVLPRSQDAKPVIKETTGLYGISRNSYEKYRCRIGSKPYFYILDNPLEYIDLDTEYDFLKLESLLEKNE